MADTIGTLIDGIANSKSNIADAIENKGVTVPSGTKLAGMASLIDQISTMHGPASSVDGNLAAFNGTTGDTLKDSGIAASSIALDSNVVHRTGDEPVTGIKTFDGNGEIRFQTDSRDAYYGYIKESSKMVLDIADNTVNIGGLQKTVVGTSSKNIELDNNLLPGGRTNVIIFRDGALNSDQSDTNSATYVFPTRNKTSGSTYTIATTDDIPAVLSTGDSNKDKYLHTNASTGALEWSSLSVTDTKNTAGSTNDTSLLYLVGAKTQAANPQTYSRNNTYINASGVLVNTAGFSSQSAGRNDYASINIGTNAVNYYSGSGPASFKATSSTHGSWQIGDNSGNIYLKKTGISGPSSGNAYLLFPNVGTSSAPKTLATDEEVVHKGTSSSSVAETIYGNKTFANPIYIQSSGQYPTNMGYLGGDSTNGLHLCASGPNLTLDTVGASIFIGTNTAGGQLKVSDASNVTTSGFTFTDKYKATSSSIVYTSTYTFPTKQADGSYTIATTDDLTDFVTGPNSVATAGNIAIYDGTTGKIIKDSTIKTSIGSSMSITLPLSSSSLYLGESTGSSYVCLTNSEGAGPSGETGPWHYIFDKISNNTYYHYLPKKTGILATTDDLTDFVHKGTSSSSIDETIYGNKTFSNQISANSGITGGTTQTAPYATLTYKLTPSKLELTDSLTGDTKLTSGNLTIYSKMNNISTKYQLNNITKTITNPITQTDTVYTYVFPDKSCTLGAAVQIIDLRS